MFFEVYIGSSWKNGFNLCCICYVSVYYYRKLLKLRDMMFGSLGMIAFLASLGLMCVLYFISSTVRNSNHPLRGTYLMSEDTFSICAPGLFEIEHAQTYAWRCGELQDCFLMHQNSALSCIDWNSDHQMIISTVRHGMISDNSSTSVLCLLNEQVKLGRCVPSFGWNESYTDNTFSPSLYQVHSCLFIGIYVIGLFIIRIFLLCVFF